MSSRIEKTRTFPILERHSRANVLKNSLPKVSLSLVVGSDLRGESDWTVFDGCSRPVDEVRLKSDDFWFGNRNQSITDVQRFLYRGKVEKASI